MIVSTTAERIDQRSDTTPPAPTIDVEAPITTVHDVVIEAPLGIVWRLQTDIEGWPAWQSPVVSARRLDAGPLRAGSRFEWATPVPESPLSPADTLVITSTVDHVETEHSVRWHGPAVGEHLRVDAGVHVWTFTAVGDTTAVHTEESWAGAMVETDIALATAALSASLETWLHNLSAAAQAAAH